MRKAQRGKLTIPREPFMVWPGEVARAEQIHREDLDSEGWQQQVIHSTGLGQSAERNAKAEIL